MIIMLVKLSASQVRFNDGLVERGHLGWFHIQKFDGINYGGQSIEVVLDSDLPMHNSGRVGMIDLPLQVYGVQ